MNVGDFDARTKRLISWQRIFLQNFNTLLGKLFWLIANETSGCLKFYYPGDERISLVSGERKA